MTPWLESMRRAGEQLEAALPVRWRPALGALAVVALSLVAIIPLFGGGLILTGDMLQAMRIYEIGRCWQDGQVPCRWVPDLGNGYGYPLFNYYPPLPYYAGGLLHRLGLSYLRAADMLYAIGLAGAGLSMYAFARRLWGELGGLVSAVAYMYAPYLALDAFMRGALAELWALAIVPALLWAIYETVTTSRARWLPVLALCTGFLLLSHSIVALIVTPAIALWAVVLLTLRGRAAFRPALLGATGALWGVGLAAFFTLPALFEGDQVHLENLTLGPFNYKFHFASAADLFFERSADYSFLLGVRDSTVVQIGWFQWIGAALAVPAGVLLWRSGRHSQALAVATLAAAFGVGVFMATPASKGIWDSFDSLAYVQFPWRYLGLVTIASGGLAGAWFAVLRDRPAALRIVLALVLIGVFVGSGRMFFHTELRFDVNDDEVLHGERSAFLGQYAIRDYLPEASDEGPPPRDARAVIVSGRGEVLSARSGSDWLTLEIDAAEPLQVEASLFDYPNWRVRIDGEEVDHTASAPAGLVMFAVPQGRHEVRINLDSTAIRRTGNVVSLVSWLALVLSVPAMAAAPRAEAWLRGRTRVRAGRSPITR